MKDRIPGAPGQYKAVITAAEQEKLAAAEPFVITLTRDDHPVTEGTPYSKAAVLPDSLAASLCPGVEDPTPADAFAALHEKSLESQAFPGCYYRIVEGEVEWLNPPMVLGEEYRTTQRHNGKAVYRKVLDLGAVPTPASSSSPGYKWTTIGIHAKCIMHWHAIAKRIIDQDKVTVLESLPCALPDSGKVVYKIYFNDKSAVITANDTVAGMGNVRLWLQYTKEAVE